MGTYLEHGVRASAQVPGDSKEGIVEHLLKSREDMSFPGSSQAEGSLEVKTEMMVNTDETALVETDDVGVVTIIKFDKIVGARDIETPILGSKTSNVEIEIITDKINPNVETDYH